MFYYCGSSTAITIPSNVSRISAYAFSDNRSVKSIEIPASVTSMSNYAFYCCYGLESIELPDGITSIGDCTFYNRTSLASIIIPGGVTSIGNYAFYNCSSLESIEIPASLTAIGENAFSGCSGLAYVYYRSTEVQWVAMSIDSSNTSVLSSANIIYNYHEHIYSEVEVTAPTCTEKGYTTYTCKVCGDSYTADETEATGHNYESVVTEPTCTEKGCTTYTCKVCDYSYKADETEATGHNYEAVITKATYTTQGYTTYTCTHCGESYEADYTAVKVMDGTDGNLSTKTTVQELTAMPDGLKKLYSSVDALVSDLIKRVIAVGTGYTEDNALVYDVMLQYSTDGGTTWITAIVDNFPADGITVILPYPDGTDSSYEFTVLHMFTVDSDRLGITAGDTESPTVTKTDDGLVFTLTGLSPVAVSWKAVTTSTTETDTSSQTDTTTENTDTANTSASSTASAQTGDETNILLWIVVMILAASGIAVIIICDRKRKYNR